MNLKSHLNSVLFSNATRNNTREAKYNPQFYSRYESQTQFRYQLTHTAA